MEATHFLHGSGECLHSNGFHVSGGISIKHPLKLLRKSPLS